ncbi:MAG: hypothetical protein AB7Q01_02685 [Gammaproteobacteria bacterium]
MFGQAGSDVGHKQGVNSVIAVLDAEQSGTWEQRQGIGVSSSDCLRDAPLVRNEERAVIHQGAFDEPQAIPTVHHVSG